MQYNFDEIIDRKGTNCIKYDAMEDFLGADSDVIPLWVADTDFKVADFIMDALRQRLDHEILGYTYRCENYFSAIQGWMKRRHNWEVKKEWITFSPGVVAGLTLAIEALTKPGDKVVVQPPVYFPFFDSVNGTDRVLVENPLKKESGRYHFDLEDFKSKIDDKTKMIIISNPHNPGGMVWTREELAALGQICIENDILIVSDEIHQDLAFSGHKFTPMASVSEEIAKRTITCTAGSKTFNIAGLTTSIVIIPNRRYRVAYERKLHTPHLHMGNIMGGIALEQAYTHGDDWVDQMMAYVEGNYNMLEAFLKKHIPEIVPMKPEGTFLVWLDCSALGMEDEELHEFMLKKAKVGLNDGPKFGKGGEGYLRINLGCPQSVLKQALEQMASAVRSRVEDTSTVL
ncbi:pyridoxal phosphate-dependent aminotransferase [Prolixibacteraceae bacterium JC049]|nr:pyridoxal phosphate-dependent aminotransferase [Prolixibacteraceae bacterium JC049]